VLATTWEFRASARLSEVWGLYWRRLYRSKYQMNSMSSSLIRLRRLNPDSIAQDPLHTIAIL
jgi:hypothetical protein